MKTCFNCNTLLRGRTQKKFCSLSCAAQVTNKLPKRKAVRRLCQRCQKVPVEGRSEYCRFCCRQGRSVGLTLRQLIVSTHHRSSAFAKVRSRARSVAKKLGWVSCAVCVGMPYILKLLT